MEQSENEEHLDLESAMQHLAAEEQREKQKSLFLQGQVFATVAFLRRSGLMSVEDIKQWDEQSERFTQILTEMTKLIPNEECEVEDENIRMTLKYATLGLELATLLGNDPSIIQDMNDRINQIKKAYPHIHV